MTGEHCAFSLDHDLIRRRFARAADRERPLAVLEREIASRMDERLDYVRIEPGAILDLGCGRGDDLAQLGLRFPKARAVGADFAQPMLVQGKARRGLVGRLFGGKRSNMPLKACADANALPFARASFDLVWSNLMLIWVTDPAPVLREIHRVLAVDGLVMFSTFGPDTLKELRTALAGEPGTRVHRFIDMHDIGDALLAAGFSDPVMDMEMLTLTYSDPDRLLADLRESAWNNASSTRPRGLGGRAGWATARRTLAAAFQSGRLPTTFEIIQGHAWKVSPKTLDDGRAVVHFHPGPTRRSTP